MSRKIPKSLEEQSAYVVANQAYRKIIAYFVDIFHPQNIPTLRIFKADESQLIRFKTCFEEIVKELAVLRRSCERIGFHIEKALEFLTDEATIALVKIELYIPALILKLRISLQVCTDKDFDYDISSSSIPPYLQFFTKTLIHRLENNDLKILIIYKELDHLIREQILCSSKNITFLNISQANITSELLVSVGKICVNLRALHLSHMDLWSCVTVESLYLCFFKGYSRRSITDSFTEDNLGIEQISFPHLQYTTIIFDDAHPFVIFHRCLLFNYKNLESLWQNRMVENFSSKHIEFTRLVLTKIANMQHIISLRSLVLNIPIINDMLPFQFLKVLKMMPFLKSVYIDCFTGVQGPEFTMRNFHHNLQLLWENSEITEVFFRRLTVLQLFTIMDTVPEEACNKIISITLSRSMLSNLNCVLMYLFSRFSFLRQIKFNTFFIVNNELDNCELACMENLVELHVHNTYFECTNNFMMMSRFIRTLARNSPNLKLLSISASVKQLSELLYIEMPVLVLHIYFVDLSFDWDLTTYCVINVVKRLYRLKILFLEEIQSELFFLVSRHFRNSNLIVKFGGLHGLPTELM